MKSKLKLLGNFSHIYVEKNAYGYELTEKILERFSKAKKIEIEDYKEFFSKSNQNFNIQKKSQKIILAVKKDKFLYPGAKVCESFGNENFYYVSSVINCIYDCEYCYLQGVYSSGNIVIFVNVDEMFEEIENELKKNSMYLCISYDTDLLALEGITGLVKKWYNFIESHRNLKIELRTKSDNLKIFEDLKSKDNFIVAWTVSPENFIKKYEKGTASFSKRIEGIKKLQKLGWKVRICFDPMIKIDDFEKNYEEMVRKTFENIDVENILDISIGTFRISKEYLKRMRKNRPNSLVLAYPFQCENGVYSYSSNEIKNMIKYVEKICLEYVEKEKIFI